ncbi:MAG: hypothetical protein M9882_02540 [Homoserinimonas sp.]|nr:hypothetical protein [Homoserinimonas sp.]
MPATLLKSTGNYDAHGVLGYLATHAIPEIEDATPQRYRRKIRTSGGVKELNISLVRAGRENYAIFGCSLDGDKLPVELEQRVRRLLSLDIDTTDSDRKLAEDPDVGVLIRQSPGLRIPGSLFAEEELVRTMIGQQVSISAARSALSRLCLELCPDSGLFPTSAMIASEGASLLRGPRARASAVIGVCQALAEGELVINPDLNPEELRERLLPFPGIGPWTIGHVAMRVLGAQDVFLSGDLVVRQGATLLGLPGDARGLERLSSRWSPYRSSVTAHLWRHALASRNSITVKLRNRRDPSHN